ncbi:MAG: hypothetical protein GWP18_01515 [Proteobacteria bacterium]|nr:hypothetical protein [Pseudomonadota bacterium]
MMRATTTKMVGLGLTLALVTIACTPTSSDTPSTTSTESTTSSLDPSTTTSTEPPVDDDGELLPPDRGKADDVATDALIDVVGFSEDGDPPRLAEDLVIAMQAWLVPDLAEGEVSTIYKRTSTDSSVSVLSVVPEMQWRGNPNFVRDLIEGVSGDDATTPADGVFGTVTAAGAHIFMWSTGDGFIMASAMDPNDALVYLEQRSAKSTVNEVWEAGSCLYLEDDESLPFAPFPPDAVVPCEGAHNAEVLIGRTDGTDLDTYDEETITYDRNYLCDKAYESAFGSQLDQAPSLVSYMPDADEWARGDRYLACVALIRTNEGTKLIAGSMADIDDLTFEPAVGSCIAAGLPADTTPCGVVHTYQFLGEVDVVAETWPTLGGSAYTDACTPLLDELPPGPAEVEVFPVGLGAYAFEQGDRTVRCMAFAAVDGFLVDVIGPFTGVWRVIGDGGLSA